MQEIKHKSFLKWVGGKIRILNDIKALLPAGDRLIEPFAGSCVVSLNTKFNKYLLADSNTDLINLYKWIQLDGEKIIRIAKRYFTEDNLTEENYYRLRDKYNDTKSTRIHSILFIYLNRHAFNGMCRYNSKGEYNIPCGRYKTVYFPEEEVLYFMKWSRENKVVFINDDFRNVINTSKENDVVYADPPYSPLTITSNFSSYTPKDFTEKDHRDLVALAEKSTVPFLISNHSTDFTKKLYKNAQKTQTLMVQRMISANGSKREKVPEILALYSK